MTNIQIEMTIAAVILFIFIIINLAKSRMSIKSSVAWLLIPLIFILIAIFPDPLSWLSNFLGFETLANFIFLITIALLIIICFLLTITISHEQEQIKKLIQEVSLLKKESSNKKHGK